MRWPSAGYRRAASSTRPLVEVIDGHIHLKLQIESRVLPGSVVKERVDEIAAEIEEQTAASPARRR